MAIEQQDYYEVHEGAVESQNYARECMGILCMLVKVSTGLQIAGCELQKMPGSAYDSAPQNREGGLELDICRGGQSS